MLETYGAMKKVASGSDKLYQLTANDICRIQECLLDMMDDIDGICRKYHLAYAISGGALLGAVRHKGFIPWDDDIDICMPRRDYNRLAMLMLKEHDDKYWVQEVRMDKKYDLNFMKIRRRDTVYLEMFDMDEKKAGVFIDVFPAENVSDIPFLRRLQGVMADAFLLITSCVRMASKSKRLFYYVSDDSILKSVRQKVLLGRILGIIPLRTWLLWADRVMSVCKNNDSEYISVPCGIKHFFGEMYRREDFYPPRRADFGGHKYCMVSSADSYLKHMYGDYMEIPDEDKREHHCVVRFSMGNKCEVTK